MRQEGRTNHLDSCAVEGCRGLFGGVDESLRGLESSTRAERGVEESERLTTLSPPDNLHTAPHTPLFSLPVLALSLPSLISSATLLSNRKRVPLSPSLRHLCVPLPSLSRLQAALVYTGGRRARSTEITDGCDGPEARCCRRRRSFPFLLRFVPSPPAHPTTFLCGKHLQMVPVARPVDRRDALVRVTEREDVESSSKALASSLRRAVALRSVLSLSKRCSRGRYGVKIPYEPQKAR
jgi:hypothetical protein